MTVAGNDEDFKPNSMKPVELRFVLAAIALLCLFGDGCRKETSCEGCLTGNQAPVALAGPDTAISLPADTILLDGSKSNDPDGKISDWLWTKISGPASFTIVTPAKEQTIVRNLEVGSYQFELKITDNKGANAKDTVEITVNDATTNNHRPVANAGADQTITLPANAVDLDGSGSTDPDIDITSYQWTEISGPSSFTIFNATNAKTEISNLIEGVYQFELKVTDAAGLFSTDTVQVSVLEQQPPCADCRIAFVSDRDGNSEIYTCSADGSDITRLTYDAATDEQPAWSPDGSRIAFVSDRSGRYEIYIMNADGSNLVRKTFPGSYSENPAWSPDGTKIAYSAPGDGSLDIWVVGVTSGSPSLLFETPGYDSYPAWSPDGTKLAIVSDWAAYDFVYDIYLTSADGSGFTALTGNIFDHVDYLSPSWSPGGTKLAISINETLGIDKYRTQLGVMNPDGSGVTFIKRDVATWTRTSWSADGKRIAYTSLSGSGKDVSWVSPDGLASGIIVTNGWNADWQH